MLEVHGLPVAEVAGLQLKDLGWVAGIVRVKGKGSKVRTIYLVESSAAALSTWLEVPPSVALLDQFFVVVGNDTNGRARSTQAVRCLADGYLDDLGLKRSGVSCHSPRHSAATWARAARAALDALAGMLGHASITTTQVYAQIVDKMVEKPARYLEAVIEL